VNVAADAESMAKLTRLGVRTVPVVSRGDKYVFAQNLREVFKFLGLSDDGKKQLAPAELAQRIEIVLSTAERLVSQIPDDKLGDKLPNRNRSYLELGHHAIRVAEAFVEAAKGAELTTASLAVPPPTGMRTGKDIAAYGAAVRGRVATWWQGLADKSARQQVATYYGPQVLHDVMERSTWHSAQHVRQIAMVVENLGIAPDRPLTAKETAGLPLPEKVWDD